MHSRRATLLPPMWALVLACGAIGLIEAAVLSVGRDVSPAVPALLLLVPVVAAGLLGGRLVAFASAMVAAVGFSMVLPPFGSVGVELGHDLLTLVLFVVVAGIAGVLLTSVALSDRRRLAAEVATVDALRRVDRDRGALLRSVSHDLRTPLATIRAAATDLRTDFPHSPETRDHLLDLVIDEAERLDRIVGNLLALSRIESGALSPDRQPVDIGELVESCVDRLRRVTGRVDLTVTVDDDLPLVRVDYSQFDQVIANLLENAVRHSPPGTRVALRVETAGDRVRISVRDHGTGIDPAVRDRLFEPFATATGSGSSGIGLAISKGVVDAHGGRIMAVEPPGGGAELIVEVPVDG